MKKIIFFLILSSFVFNCNKDDNSDEFQRCWTIINAVTGDPISGAEVEILYEHYICYACPYREFLTSGTDGKACSIFKEGSTFVGIIVNKSGFIEYYEYSILGGIPKVIRLLPQS